MTQLFIRQPSGDSEWTDEAAAICNSFADVVRFAMREAELDGPVDLRDLQTLMKSAIDDVILHEMVCRRLRPNEDTQPRGERGTQGGEWGSDDTYEMT